MATSYAKMTLAQLERERAKIDKAIEMRSGKEKKSLVAKLKSLAAESGFEINELFSDDSAPAPVRKKKRASSKKKAAGKRVSKKKASGKKRGKAPQIYRNPDDHAETWSGRGRPPRWVVDHVAGGGDKEDLRF